MQAGYLYYLISGVMFVFMAVWLFVKPPALFMNNQLYQWLLPAMLLLWGAYRLLLGYNKYKTKKRDFE